MRKMSDDNANVQWVSRSEQTFISVSKYLIIAFNHYSVT